MIDAGGPGDGPDWATAHAEHAAAVRARRAEGRAAALEARLTAVRAELNRLEAEAGDGGPFAAGVRHAVARLRRCLD